MTNMLNRRYSSFCSLGIDRIDSHNFQRLIDDLSTLGRSPKYIRNIHGLISAVLTNNDTAVPKVRLPEKKPPKVYEPSKDDIRQAITAAAGTRLEIPILLGIHGLRRGEICALRYPDDFDGNTVHVQRSRVYVGKTLTSINHRRTIPLTVLSRWIRHW